MDGGTYLIVGSLVLWLFRAYVLMDLWNWFVVLIFHAPQISYAQMWGLLAIVYLICSAVLDKPWPDEDRWTRLLRVLEQNVSNEVKEALEKDVDFQSAAPPRNASGYLLSQVLNTICAFAIGWGIHRFFL